MKLSIIIPVFNEEKTIKSIIIKIEKIALEKIEKEIIIINDGSTDTTGKVLVEMLERNDKIIYIHHKENSGKGAAIRSGIKKAKGDYILIQDADLEYDPYYIPSLIEPILKRTAMVVYGTRLKRLPNFLREEKTPLFMIHYFGNRFLSLLVSILHRTWLTDIETGYKILPKKFIKEIEFSATGFEIEAEITVKLLKKGYTILEVPIKTKPRGYGEGKKLRTIPDGIKAISMILRHTFMSGNI